MRERTVQINIRATEKERTRYIRNAKKCGLTLSEYLRKLANKHEPKSLPPLEYSELMQMISDLYVDFYSTGDAKYADLLIHVLQNLQKAIAPNKRGDEDGDDKNLADS
jgi:hypothetical protein